MTYSIRWAFNVKEWKPNRAQWLLCMQCIQKEERDRCNRFCYVNDCKSSLIGQLLMRKAVSESTSTAYDKIIFARTVAGKPYLLGNEVNRVFFNVSHSGDFCVLASELDFMVGIDVMKIDHRGKKSVPEFFNLMQSQFSPSEWNFITFPGFEREQLERFYRLWCLKESYVKATGTGISYKLETLSFTCNTFSLKYGDITTDTKLYKDGISQKEWKFEETLLDTNHCVAVAVGPKKEQEFGAVDYTPKSFEVISFERLMEHSVPFEKSDEIFWESFICKPEKN